MKKIALFPVFLALCLSNLALSMESSPKKRKEVEEAPEQQQIISCPRTFFSNQDIENIIIKLMTEEKGKLWAAYYMVTSEKLSSWWANRKYIQEFRKAIACKDIKAISVLEVYKTCPKHDILIVDEEGCRKDSRAIKKLSDSGIEVLIRNKKHAPFNSMQKMHHKFLIIFDEDNRTGKFVITGSYNMTNQAHYNWEDATILNDANCIAQFIQQHNDLRPYCTNYKELSNAPSLPQITPQATPLVPPVNPWHA